MELAISTTTEEDGRTWRIKNRELLLVTGQVFIGVVSTACESYLFLSA